MSWHFVSSQNLVTWIFECLILKSSETQILSFSKNKGKSNFFLIHQNQHIRVFLSLILEENDDPDPLQVQEGPQYQNHLILRNSACFFTQSYSPRVGLGGFNYWTIESQKSDNIINAVAIFYIGIGVNINC